MGYASWMANSRLGDIPEWACKTGGMPDVISILPLEMEFPSEV
jgi:hypothetical protein